MSFGAASMNGSDLTAFRLLLDHLDLTSVADPIRYFQLLSELSPEEIAAELKPRLLRVSTPKEHRALFVEAAFYYPCREWIDTLGLLLRRETGPITFSVGVWALGRMGSGASVTLGALYDACTNPEFKELISHEILRTDPRQAFKYHLKRLMEGSANTRVANEAAQELVRIVSGEHLAELAPLARHEDLLIARQALKLLAQIQTPEAGAFFLTFLQDTHAEILADRDLRETLGLLKGAPTPTLLGLLAPQVADVFGAEEMEGFEGGGLPQRLQIVARIRARVQTPRDGFLAEALALVVEGRWTQWPTFLTEASDALQRRARNAIIAMDISAHAVGDLAVQGMADLAAVQAAVQAAYVAQTGKEGVATVFGKLVPAEDLEGLECLLAGQEAASRAAALEAVGNRKEPALLSFLLRACKDPIVETARRAMASVGQIPEAEAMVLELLHSANGDEVRLALDIAGIGRMAGLIPEILKNLDAAPREELMVACVEALGLIGSVEAAPVLLGLLHSGQSQRLQSALILALGQIGDVDAVLSAAERANEMRNPQIHMLVAESILQIHGTIPLAPRAVDLFRQQVRGAWEEKNPWPTRQRLILAMQSLQTDDGVFCQEMATLAATTLADKRCQTAWSPTDQTAIKAVIQGLQLRASK